jgi:hypothetical protein
MRPYDQGKLATINDTSPSVLVLHLRRLAVLIRDAEPK